jgi:hypothetical protein
MTKALERAFREASKLPTALMRGTLMATRAGPGSRWLILVALLSVLQGQALVAKDRDRANVNSAIDELRGHDSRTLTTQSSKALDEKLDKAWDILTKYASISKKRIPEVLADERNDSFLLIDLSYLYLVLHEGSDSSMASASTWLLRADPGAHPSGYFNASSVMGSKRCQSCLPAVLGLLRLERLGASIAEHALLVDLDMGFLFAIGPYGTGATGALVEALQDSSCTVRKNAVRMTRFLLDPGAVSAVRAVASGDTCPEARNEAWTALGILGDVQLGGLIRRRMASEAEVPKEEKLAMVSGLEALYRSPDRWVAERLAQDPEPEVSAAATKMIAETDDADADRLLANVGSKSSTERARALNPLKDAIRTGSFEFEGTAFELEAMLTPADLASVNEARASILRRASDECLYEWKKLYLVGTLLVQLQASNQAPGTQ